MNRTQRAKMRAQMNLLDTYKEDKENTLIKVKQGYRSAFISRDNYSSFLKDADKTLKEKKKSLRLYKEAMLSEARTNNKEVPVGA